MTGVLNAFAALLLASATTPKVAATSFTGHGTEA